MDEEWAYRTLAARTRKPTPGPLKIALSRPAVSQILGVASQLLIARRFAPQLLVSGTAAFLEFPAASARALVVPPNFWSFVRGDAEVIMERLFT
jgi:hypothetical protein